MNKTLYNISREASLPLAHACGRPVPRLGEISRRTSTKNTSRLAQLSQRDHAAGWVSYGKRGRLELGDNIYEHYKLYSTNVTYLASKAIEFGKKRKKGYYAVQVHSRSSRSVPIESPLCDFLLVIDSN